MKPTLLVIRGPPGAGKSTIALKVGEALKRKTLVFNLDALHHGMALFLLDEFKGKKERLIAPVIVDNLRRGVNVIVEAVIGGPRTHSKLQYYKGLATACKANFLVVSLHAPWQHARKRCLTRKNHIIPSRMSQREMKKWYDWAYMKKVNGSLAIDTSCWPIEKSVREIVALVRMGKR